MCFNHNNCIRWLVELPRESSFWYFVSGLKLPRCGTVIVVRVLPVDRRRVTSRRVGSSCRDVSRLIGGTLTVHGAGHDRQRHVGAAQNQQRDVHHEGTRSQLFLCSKKRWNSEQEIACPFPSETTNVQNKRLTNGIQRTNPLPFCVHAWSVVTFHRIDFDLWERTMGRSQQKIQRSGRI